MKTEESLEFTRVSSLSDIARAAAASIGVGQPVYLLRYKRRDGRHVVGMLAVLRDYYTLYGVPMLYYYECEPDDAKCAESNYVAFKLDESGERVELTNRSVPGYIMIPILNLELPPSFLLRGEEEEKKRPGPARRRRTSSTF